MLKTWKKSENRWRVAPLIAPQGFFTRLAPGAPRQAERLSSASEVSFLARRASQYVITGSMKYHQWRAAPTSASTTSGFCLSHFLASPCSFFHQDFLKQLITCVSMQSSQVKLKFKLINQDRHQTSSLRRPISTS